MRDLLENKKRALLIYNPVAGEGAFKLQIDEAVELLQQENFQVLLHRTSPEESLAAVFENCRGCIDLVIAAGGDGTIHTVVNEMLKNNFDDLPLGILPVGTSNDIANHMGISLSLHEAVEVLRSGTIRKIDIGEANGVYFVNVASGGLMMEVPHTTSVRLKNLTGRLAYYLKGIEKLPNLRPISARITFENKVIEEDILLFLVLNGGNAGGFKKIAPEASMLDGKLDVLLIKPMPIARLLAVFVKILKGEHVGDPALTYFQTSSPIEITCDKGIGTDVDGEKGPEFPMRIRLHPGRIAMFMKTKE